MYLKFVFLHNNHLSSFLKTQIIQLGMPHGDIENYQSIKKSRLIADLTPSSLVIWVNISEPIRLARFFRCLVFR